MKYLSLFFFLLITINCFGAGATVSSLNGQATNVTLSGNTSFPSSARIYQSGNLFINPSAGLIYDQSGSGQQIDVFNQQLIGGANLSLDWVNRTFNDTSGNFVGGWGTGIIIANGFSGDGSGLTGVHASTSAISTNSITASTATNVVSTDFNNLFMLGFEWGNDCQAALLSSSDGNIWSAKGANPVFGYTGFKSEPSWNFGGTRDPRVFCDQNGKPVKIGGSYWVATTSLGLPHTDKYWTLWATKNWLTWTSNHVYAAGSKSGISNTLVWSPTPYIDSNSNIFVITTQDTNSSNNSLSPYYQTCLDTSGTNWSAAQPLGGTFLTNMIVNCINFQNGTNYIFAKQFGNTNFIAEEVSVGITNGWSILYSNDFAGWYSTQASLNNAGQDGSFVLKMPNGNWRQYFDFNASYLGWSEISDLSQTNWSTIKFASSPISIQNPCFIWPTELNLEQTLNVANTPDPWFIIPTTSQSSLDFVFGANITSVRTKALAWNTLYSINTNYYSFGWDYYLGTSGTAGVYLFYSAPGNVSGSSGVIGSFRTDGLHMNVFGNVVGSISGGNVSGNGNSLTNLSTIAMPYRSGLTNMPNLATSAVITFSVPINPNVGTNYMVDFGEEGSFAATSFAYPSAKTTNGFTLNLTTGITGGGIVTWHAEPYTQTNNVSVGY